MRDRLSDWDLGQNLKFHETQLQVKEYLTN